MSSALGVTDYCLTLIFTNGEINVATWTTREPGFTNDQIEGIESVIAPLARVTEVRSCAKPRSVFSIPTSETKLGAHPLRSNSEG